MRAAGRAGLIVRNRNAQWRSSSLRAEPLREVTAWMEPYRQFWDTNLDRLDVHLQRIKHQQQEEANND
jgi:hypothetical protein